MTGEVKSLDCFWMSVVNTLEVGQRLTGFTSLLPGFKFFNAGAEYADKYDMREVAWQIIVMQHI
jgi:hypothetical protein